MHSSMALSLTIVVLSAFAQEHGPLITTWLQLGPCDHTAIVWERDEVKISYIYALFPVP